MIHMGSKTYDEIQTVFRGIANEAVIIREPGGSSLHCNIVQIIKDRTVAKELLAAFEQMPVNQEDYKAEAVCMNETGQLCFLFPYIESRPINRFFNRTSSEPGDYEQICRNLLVECMKNSLPFPLLYLILEQRLIHISKDHQLSFSFQFDLSGFNCRIGEFECVRECSRIILWILEESRNTPGAELIRKKVKRGVYRQFTELFHDVKLLALPEEKGLLFQKIYKVGAVKKGGLLRLAVVLCMILAVFTLILLITEVLYGDIPFLRIFENGIEYIGTEPMLQ